MGSTEQQIIATLAGIMLTGVGAFAGRYVPIWYGQWRRWSRDRAVILNEHDALAKQLSEVAHERDELRASLNSASQGSNINRELIDGLKQRIDEMEGRLDEQALAFADAVRYIADLTTHIIEGGTEPLPHLPDSISDEVRDELRARIEHRKAEAAT